MPNNGAGEVCDVAVSLLGGPVDIRGSLSIEKTAEGIVPHRLPAWCLARLPGAFFRAVEAQPSGVRLVFRTDATEFELDVLTTVTTLSPGVVEAYGIFDVVVDGALWAQASTEGAGLRRIEPGNGTATVTPGTPGTIRISGLPAVDKQVEVWLPHDVEVELRALRANAELSLPEAEHGGRWVHYGSSISHGSNATHPRGTWPAVAAAVAGLNVRNLGFAGNALLDPFMARVVADCDADLISLELGINVVNHDAYGARMFTSLVHGFIDMIRDSHPTTPLVVVSAMLCPAVEHSYGPTAIVVEEGRQKLVSSGPGRQAADRLTLSDTRKLLSGIVSERSLRDTHLHYVDGRELYGEREARAMPLPDGLHPGPDAHRHIGQVFAAMTGQSPAGDGLDDATGLFPILNE